MALRYDTISFLSDYGHDDEFVGVVKSVIRAIAPDVAVIDVTHEVPAHDVRAGGLALARSAQYLCPGVVLAVVDPGVGGPRRSVAVEVGDGTSVLVGPDNGLLAPAVALVGGASRAVELTEDAFQLEAPGATFAGRDVFAPAAAHLCQGVDLLELGPAVDPAGLLPSILPISHLDDSGAMVAEVLWVDRFGNAQLNVDPAEVEPFGDRIRLRMGDDIRTAKVVVSYDEIGPGEIGLVVDSYGVLSIAAGQRSAADQLGIRAGTAILLDGLDDDTPEGPGERTVTRVHIGAPPTAGQS
jgi:S-adenosyl-L-methionine hydrolase (adenosine-forming)